MESVHYYFNKLFKKRIALEVYKKNLLPRVKRFNKTDTKGTLNNILHVNTVVGIGGAAKAANWLHKNLNVAGFNSKMLVEKKINSFDDTIFEFEKDISPKQNILLEAQKELGWLDFFNSSSLNIRNNPHFSECDLIHLHNLHGNYFSLFSLPEITALKPTIWTLHDEQSYTGHCSSVINCDKWISGCGNCPDLKIYPEISTDSTAFLWKTKKEIYNNSDLHLVCPSNWLKKRVEKSILKEHPSTVIYNGIDFNIFKPTDKKIAKKMLKLPDDKIILLLGCNFSEKNSLKGSHYIREVFNYFINDKRILFITINDNGRTGFENLVNIPFVNDEEKMALIYSAADLFIFPSLAETFGLMTLESLACKTPVIAFNNGPTPELVSHLKTGYLANYLDAQDLIKGTKTFIENDHLRLSASNEAQDSVNPKFSIENNLSSYIKLYNEVFASHKLVG